MWFLVRCRSVLLFERNKKNKSVKSSLLGQIEKSVSSDYCGLVGNSHASCAVQTL
jgi:hypothetical protein